MEHTKCWINYQWDVVKKWKMPITTSHSLRSCLKMSCFVWPKCPKLKCIHFTMTADKEEQQICTFKKLEHMKSQHIHVIFAGWMTEVINWLSALLTDADNVRKPLWWLVFNHSLGKAAFNDLAEIGVGDLFHHESPSSEKRPPQFSRVLNVQIVSQCWEVIVILRESCQLVLWGDALCVCVCMRTYAAHPQG